MKRELIELIKKIDREDIIKYLYILTEDIVKEVYGSEVLDNE